MMVIPSTDGTVLLTIRLTKEEAGELAGQLIHAIDLLELRSSREDQQPPAHPTDPV